MGTPTATATIYSNHTEGRKNDPRIVEGWLNAETKEYARELGKVFPDFAWLDTEGKYSRLFFRIHAEAGVAEVVRRLDAFLDACKANDVAVTWYVSNAGTLHTAEEFDQYVRPLAK